LKYVIDEWRRDNPKLKGEKIRVWWG